MDCNGNNSPNKKDIKLVQLKWISRTDKKKSPSKPRKKYDLRNRKKQATSPKKQSTSPKKHKISQSQKKIDSFFSTSPKCKSNNNDKVIETTPSKLDEDSDYDFYLSPSAKLDSKVPKVEDILRARENEEKFKKIHAMIEDSSKRFLQGLEESDQLNVPVKEDKQSVELNHCKHLTKDEIAKKFRRDAKFVDDIFYGRVYNERHELFKKDTPLNNGTKNDLRVNETNIAFSQDQLIYIISLFRDRYDKGNIYKYADFYFKVLLPEYCLKIYSDVYKINRKAAVDYLKTFPVEDVLIIA